MNVYIGKSLEDIKSVVPQGTIVFEERFKKFTYMEYEDCWNNLQGINNVICKTRDAASCAPEDATIIRVGRSIRTSDKGQIVQTSMTRDHFKWLEL